MNIPSISTRLGLIRKNPVVTPTQNTTNYGISFGRKKTATKDIFVKSRFETRATPEQAIGKNEAKGITRDGFTGLRDKRYLLQRLDEKMQEAKENGQNIGIAMFDMDNFKSVNELLGYETGDEFIKHIGSSVQEVAREHSMGSYRFGGEEFVVIFQNKSVEEMEEVCSQIQNKINSNNVFGKYSEKYVQNAKKLLYAYKEDNMHIEAIQKLKIQKELLKSLTEESPEFAVSDIIKSRLEGIDNVLKSYYTGLISHSLKREQNVDTRNKLDSYLHALKTAVGENTREVIYNDEYLNNYIAYKYDKAAQIAQIKMWLGEHTRNNGFTITCGIVDIPSEKLSDYAPMDLIDEAGEILKEGKHTKKGDMYFHNEE